MDKLDYKLISSDDTEYYLKVKITSEFMELNYKEYSDLFEIDTPITSFDNFKDLVDFILDIDLMYFLDEIRDSGKVISYGPIFLEDFKDYKIGQDLEFDVYIFTIPYLKLPDYKNIDLNLHVNNISYNNIEDRVQKILDDRPVYKTADNPIIEKGDLITITYSTHEGNADNTEIIDISEYDTRYVKDIADIPVEDLYGLKIGETLSHKCKDNTYTILTVNTINKLVVPSFTPDYLKDAFGETVTIEDLNDSAIESLWYDRNDEFFSEIESRVVEYLISNTDLFIPEALVQYKTKECMSNAKFDTLDYHEHILLHHNTEEEYSRVVREDVITGLKIYYISHNIGNKENIFDDAFRERITDYLRLEAPDTMSDYGYFVRNEYEFAHYMETLNFIVSCNLDYEETEEVEF